MNAGDQKDPWPAYQLRRDFGAILPAQERTLAAMPRMSHEELLQHYRARAEYQLGLVALERNEVYGTELLLSQEELNQRMQKDHDLEQRSRTATAGRTLSARREGC